MWIPPAHSPIRPADLSGALAAGEADVDELERYLEKRFGAGRALATGSGTDALRLALQVALAAAPRDRRVVALPAYGCFDIATAAVGAGAPLVFYDVSPTELGPEAGSLEAVARRAGVLVVANLYGFPLDHDTVRRVADAHGCRVVEDAAQGVGSAWRGRAGGTMGDLTVLSFGRGKGWTGGAGGALLLRDPDVEVPRGSDLSGPHGSGPALAAACLAQALLGRPALYGLAARVPGTGLGKTVYREPRPPTRMHPFAARLARASRHAATREMELRRVRARRLRQVLRETGVPPERLPLPPRAGESADLRLPLLLADAALSAHAGEGGARGDLRRWGVYPGYPRPLPDLPPVAPLRVEPDRRWPGAERLSRSLVTVPTHSRVPEARLEEALTRLLGEST